MAESETAISFGQFQLLADRRVLLATGERVPLGSRALDILLALVENRGRLVAKQELMARVWPNTVVDESNLKVHISALRRALGDAGRQYLLTDAGRGYRFVAPITAASVSPPTEAILARRTHNLPTSLTRLIGRDQSVAEVTALLERARLVTIVGPGGIGKTRVALAVAGRLASDDAQAITLVELGSVKDPALMPTALASALGLENRTDPLAEVIAFLRERQGLLLLDNCEHVIDAAASAAEAVLKAAPGTRILATSREALHAEGERIHRLVPLDMPKASAALDAAEALRFPAIELFVERAGATLGDYMLTDADAPVVAEICRRLDGLALAIELAAARSDVLGPKELAARLRESFRLLTSGRRTALPRHQTLRATLDWSYALLSEAERTMLRKLAVFVGGYTLQAAAAVASDEASSVEEIVDQVSSLVAKSLVDPEIGGAVARYRFLETTRSYALEKLREASDADAVARSHANYYRDLLERAEAAWERTRPAEWLAPLRPEIDNLRAALVWAFGPRGDASLGVALASASVLLWMELSLLGECQDWIDRALTRIENGSQAERQASALRAAQELSVMHRRLVASLERAVARAEQVDNQPRLAHAVYWLGRVHYVLGDQQYAIACARRCLAIGEALSDRSLAAQSINLLGRAYWLVSGFAEAALLMERSVAEMRSLENDLEVAMAAANAAGLRALLGDFEQAFQHLEISGALAIGLKDPFVEASAHFYRGVAHALRGSTEPALEGFEACRRVAEQSGNLFRIYVSKFWQGWVLARCGETDRARALLEEAKALAAQLGTGFMLSWVEAILASAVSVRDGFEAALVRSDAAIRHAAKAGDRFGTALARRARAEILLDRTPPAVSEAAEEIAEAIRIQQEIGVRPELARSCVAHADVLRAMDDAAASAASLRRAIELFREMDMAAELAAAEGLLRLSEA